MLTGKRTPIAVWALGAYFVCSAMFGTAGVVVGIQASEPAETSQPAAAPDRVAMHPHIVASSVRPPATAAGSAAPIYGLTRADLADIKEALPNLRLALPVREVRGEARFGEHLSDSLLIGTTAEYAPAHRLAMARGRFLTDQDIEQLENVAVIGQQIAENLFPEQDPIGKSIRIRNHYFLVVGTLGSGGAGRGGIQAAPGMEVFVPVSTMRARLGDREIERKAGAFTMEHFELSRIELFVENSADVESTRAILERLLTQSHDDGSFEASISPEHKGMKE